MNENVIDVVDIRRDFVVGDETVHALRGVSFTIKQGEFVTIMGASGSGKSTLLNIIGCLDTPTSGEYYLDTRTSFEILTLFQKLHLVEGRTIIFVTHNPNIANYCSRNIVLSDGKIKEDTYNQHILDAAETLKSLPIEDN